ncbi:glutathionyl-hydroquinone reductase YqjG-like [Saccoglossus kowalevskii]|uniref:Glutathione S-transferase omega-like 2-like n=1 Tax=Saccoglossus kowalevskii TaxID=10224 RepID=A0ABM0MBA4_SACKO|nr:PREDICTED: glutathione S-transferase omega-like 2-like [Saccoglossus kowalevskii]
MSSTQASNVSVQEDQTDKDARRARGEYVRGVGAARNWITTDGSTGFKAEANRYHLYIANNCPWCHRCVLTRSVKGLQDVISMDVCWYRRDEDKGWQFNPDIPGCTPDTVNGKKYIIDIYKMSGLKQSSVPILWDKQTKQVVNNESAEIIRMLNSEFNQWAKESINLYPPSLRGEIDDFNSWIYPEINNGVYKAGFAKSQEAYDVAVKVVFQALDRLDKILSNRRFLCGDQLTEADIRLFPTLFRFDHVYVVRFKCNKKMLQDYDNLGEYIKDIYQYSGVAMASNLDHCVKGYFGRSGNGIVPIGPGIDFSLPTKRSQMI